MFEEDQYKSAEQNNWEEIDYLLHDFPNNVHHTQQDTATPQKKDALIFIIDCSIQLLQVIPGDPQSQFQMIMHGLSSLLKTKIISSPQDKVGLIFYNVDRTQNGLKFNNICVPFALDTISAEVIRATDKMYDVFKDKYGFSLKRTPLHQVLWLYKHQLKNIDKTKHHLRLFLFTNNDDPHPIGQAQRDIAINHAKQLSQMNVQIQLFPLKKTRDSIFNIKKFYSQIIVLDPEEINPAALDATAKIMDLQQRLKQKQFKKRNLSRVLFNINEQIKMGLKVYCTFNKAKKPLGKKLDGKSNKILKKNTKYICQDTGQTLYANQIGTFYPLGGQKVKINKDDLKKIKEFQPPSMTLIGFKPRSSLKIHHNYRSSYFVYPDQQHVEGSSQMADALIKQMKLRQKVAIVRFVPRLGSQIRFCCLLAQQQKYDQDHFQTPPGFNLVFLPYADDIVKPKLELQPTQISQQLLSLTRLMVNNLTLNQYDSKNFQNPSLQKFYLHLQAHALNQEQVEDGQDLLQPDQEGMEMNADIFRLLNETLDLQSGQKPKSKMKIKEQAKSQKKKSIKQEQKIEQQQQYEGQGWLQFEQSLLLGQKKGITLKKLKEYLHSKKLKQSGLKNDLIQRALNHIKQR